MDSEDKIIDYLASLGFQGQRLEKDVKNGLSSGQNIFHVIKHSIPYGEELMRFELTFQKDQQFDAYRLQKYKATHRREVHIRHDVFAGIDTYNLEQRMKVVDWESWFGAEHSKLNESDKKYIGETIDLLKKLSAQDDPFGHWVQERLMYKYWPVEAYEHPRKSEMQRTFESSREFVPRDVGGFNNANLIYHLLSGNLDHLYYDKLHPMGMERFPGINVYDALEKALSRNPDQFDLGYWFNRPEGLAYLHVDVKKGSNSFDIEKYTLELILYPQIAHGVFNSIDTLQLERLMQQINWKDDSKLYVIDEKENGHELLFDKSVSFVLDQLKQLKREPAAKDLVMQLQLKYWTDADVFNDMIPSETWAYQRSLPVRKYEFDTTVEVKTAFNLLSGRAVQERFLRSSQQESRNWTRLDFAKENPEVTVASFNPAKLMDTLRMLPLQADRNHIIAHEMSQGSIVQATLKNDTRIFLEANPEHQTVNIYSRDMQPVQVNLGFDPNWKPSVKAVENTSALTKEKVHKPPAVKPVFRHKRNRGRGL